jgi:hypothetical protein
MKPGDWALLNWGTMIKSKKAKVLVHLPVMPLN